MIRPTLLALALFSVINSACAAPDTPLPHSPGAPYAASGLADRIVLTPGADPAREMAVTFRTDTRQQTSQLQLAPALDGPQLAKAAHEVQGTSISLDNENGAALFHQVRLHDLQPGTAYVYRVKGSDGWSEWLQFHTATKSFKPFNFIYMGDVQNDILSLASRSIRQALQSVANPALIVHAGDLVSQREDLVHDDQWGEWNQAGGFNYGMIPQLVATNTSTASTPTAAKPALSGRTGAASSPCRKTVLMGSKTPPTLSTIRVCGLSSLMAPRRSIWAPLINRPAGLSRA